jgi:hypothetical protein
MSTPAKTDWSIGALILLIIVIALAFGFLRVRQTETAKLPEVSVSGGQAPKIDVDAAKVDVGTTATSVPVPKIETDRAPVTVPTVSVKKPGE